MKKTIAMLLTLGMSLSLCACGGDTGPAAEEPVPEEVVEATPEPTPEPTATPEPTPEPTATPEPTSEPTPEPEVIEIEITLDNWQEYFEVTTDAYADYTENAFGEQQLDMMEINYVVTLKEEYRDQLAPGLGGHAAFRFSYDSHNGEYETYEAALADDYEDRSWMTWNEVETDVAVSDENDYTGGIAWTPGTQNEDGYIYLLGAARNFEATRVEGSIFLYE